MPFISAVIHWQQGLCSDGTLKLGDEAFRPERPCHRVINVLRTSDRPLSVAEISRRLGYRAANGCYGALRIAISAGEAAKHTSGKGFVSTVADDFCESNRPIPELRVRVDVGYLRAAVASAASEPAEAPSDTSPASVRLEDPAIDVDALKWIEAAFVGDDELAKDILQILTADAPADRKMRKAVRTDSRFMDWPSTRWAKALRISDASVRQTPFWQELRTAARARRTGRARTAETD